MRYNNDIDDKNDSALTGRRFELMQSVNLLIPDEIIFEVKSQPNNRVSINEKFKQSLAIGMFVSQEISLAKAAKLAGSDLAGFMNPLKHRVIPFLPYTEEMLEDDLRFVHE